MSFATALASAAGGLSFGSSVMAGQAAKAEGAARQEELKRAAELAEIGAKEAQASRLGDLNRTIGSIRALTGARNINPNSPSAMAMEDAARRSAGRDIQREQFNTRQQTSNLRLAGQAAKKGGEQRATAYYLQGASSAFRTGANIYTPKKAG